MLRLYPFTRQPELGRLSRANHGSCKFISPNGTKKIVPIFSKLTHYDFLLLN